MKPASSDTASLIGNLAALIVVALAMAFAVDQLASYVGRQPGLLCTLLRPVGLLAGTVAIVMVTVGVVVAVFSRFQQFSLLLGGLVLGALPDLFTGFLGGGLCPG